MAEGLQLFSVYGKVLLQDDGVTEKLKNITKQGQNLGSGLNDSFSKIKGAALKLGAALGASLGFKSIIDGASASQEKLAQMDTVL